MQEKSLPKTRSRKKVSGSETRQRRHYLVIRLTEEEKMQAEASASKQA